MTSQKQRIFSIKQAYFKPYGRIIDYPRRTARGRLNLFRIIVRQRRTGSRIAYLVVRKKL